VRHRLVVDTGDLGTDQGVGGVRAEGELPGARVAPQVERDRLANHFGHRHAAARSPARELLVGRLGKA